MLNRITSVFSASFDGDCITGHTKCSIVDALGCDQSWQCVKYYYKIQCIDRKHAHIQETTLFLFNALTWPLHTIGGNVVN